MGKLLVSLILCFALVSCFPNRNKEPAQSQSNKQTEAEEKFGLPEGKRKQIAEEIIQLQYEASKTAGKKYPFDLTDLLKHPKLAKKRLKANRELYRSLLKKALSDLCMENNISLNQLNEIYEEGGDKGWIRTPPPIVEYR